MDERTETLAILVRQQNGGTLSPTDEALLKMHFDATAAIDELEDELADTEHRTTTENAIGTILTVILGLGATVSAPYSWPFVVLASLGVGTGSATAAKWLLGNRRQVKALRGTIKELQEHRRWVALVVLKALPAGATLLLTPAGE